MVLAVGVLAQELTLAPTCQRFKKKLTSARRNINNLTTGAASSDFFGADGETYWGYLSQNQGSNETNIHVKFLDLDNMNTYSVDEVANISGMADLLGFHGGCGLTHVSGSDELVPFRVDGVNMTVSELPSLGTAASLMAKFGINNASDLMDFSKWSVER